MVGQTLGARQVCVCVCHTRDAEEGKGQQLTLADGGSRRPPLSLMSLIQKTPRCFLVFLDDYWGKLQRSSIRRHREQRLGKGN